MNRVCRRNRVPSCLRCVVALVIGRGLGAQTPAELVHAKYEVDQQHSSIAFTARILRVVKVPGRFLEYSATIIYDPLHPDLASVTAVILAKSLTTDMSFRDNHLRSPDFIDSDQYPLIIFRSDSVRPSSNGLLVRGQLSLHGVTRPVTLPVAIVLPPDTNNPASNIVFTAFEATLRLSRADYGIAGSNKFNPSFDPATNLVADSFDVTLEMSAQHQGYRNRTFSQRPPRSIGDTLLKIVETKGIEEAVRQYARLHDTQPQAYNFDVDQLDLLGHLLVERGRMGDAIRIFQLNTQAYPGEGSAFDALGEGECLIGDRAGARQAFERAAQLDSTDTTPLEMLRRLPKSNR